MTSDRGPAPSSSDEGSRASDGKRAGRVAAALALGLVVLPVQVGLLAAWGAATDVPVAEALARLLGMTTSGMPGFFLLSGLGALLLSLAAFAVTYGAARVVLRDGRLALVSLGSAVVVTLVTGMAVGADRSARTESLVGRAEEMSRRADERVEALASATRVETVSVAAGPLYRSMGATTDNPRPEWGELHWSVEVSARVEVPSSAVHQLAVEYWLPGEDAPHATLERELALEEGSNPVAVTLDANDSRGYQGFWDPERSGGSLVLVLRRSLAPDELYGDGLTGLLRGARRMFGEAAADLRPTSRTVEVVRERFEL